MAHVVTEPCRDCKHAQCVAVCPSDSFREGERMMFIDPENCIDCEACVAACPVNAIFHEADLPADWLPYRDFNATMARQSPAALARINSLNSLTD